MAVSRRTVLKTLVATTVGVAAGTTAHGLYAPDPVLLGETTVPVAGLPPSLAGLRVGLVTDVHHSRFVSAAHIEAAVSLLLTARPDLVVLGGDYVTWGDRRFVAPSAEVLGMLHAPHGVFAVLGNHDDDRDMPRALRSKRIEVLTDARTTLTIRNERLDLAGLQFWTRAPSAIARVLKGAGGTVVLLAHDPRRLPDARALGIPLVLSGHTHGGQVVLPLVGAIAAQKFPVVAGIALSDATTLFVSRGVGTVYVPVRVNCPPEVNVLTLEPAPPA